METDHIWIHWRYFPKKVWLCVMCIFYALTGFKFSGVLLAPRFTVRSPKIPTLGAWLAPRILRYKYNDIVASQMHKTYAISHFTRHYHYRPILLHFSTLANTNENLEVPSLSKHTLYKTTQLVKKHHFNFDPFLWSVNLSHRSICQGDVCALTG